MYCTNCGTQLPEIATVCENCQTPVPYSPPPPDVPNYLVHSALATLCCCLPVGIVAIVYSALVSSRLASGDVAGAQTASRRARMWSLIALILGVLVYATLVALLIFVNRRSLP